MFQTQIEENEELWGKSDETVQTSQEETWTDGKHAMLIFSCLQSV